MEFKARVKDCQRLLRQRGKDVAVVSRGPNMRYFSGFEVEPSERLLLLLIPSGGDPVFVASELYSQEIQDSSIENAKFWEDDENPNELVREVFEDIGVQEVVVDDRMWSCFLLDLMDIAPEASFSKAEDIFTQLRITKSEHEIDRIREASDIADRVVEDVRDKEVVGMTEKELAGFIESKLEQYGGEGPSFDTVVAAGENGSRPHHQPGEKEIRPGEPVVLDFGTVVDGYPSDQTRILVFREEPDDRFKQVFEVVKRAQQEAVEAIEPGATAGEVDEAARSVIEEAGYGDQFTHRTGHGVGLDIHEHPEIKRDNERELESGMVFSVEPGIYLKDDFGVRIEDLVVVTEDGCERLNKTDRDYMVG